jgi:hypothetical protein
MTATVLLLADEFFPTHGVRTMLSMLQLETLGPAADMAHAVDLMRERRPSVALLDIEAARPFVFTLADCLAGEGIPFGFVGSGGALCAIPERHQHRPALRKPFGINHMENLLRGLGCIRPRMSGGRQ